MTKFQSIKGMHDIGPKQILLWQKVEKTAKEVFEAAGFFELKTPILEPEELFSHSLGLSSDVVSKEMYAFTDKSDQKVCLRPEGTASVVRSYIQHYAAQAECTRFYYMGPMFRYERPQKGRFRQFYQIGLESFGSQHPWTDAELVQLACEVFTRLSISYTLKVNSLGCSQCRKEYKIALQNFVSSFVNDLCEDCKKRLDKNPLRILDCKNEHCKSLLQDAPLLADHICEICLDHFNQFQWALRKFNISYEVDPKLVRGLDYYERTCFEFVSDHLGSQNAIAGGGRYDGLVKLLGGPDQAGVGFAFGLERVVDLLSQKQTDVSASQQIYIAALEEEAMQHALIWLKNLRALGFTTHLDFEKRSLKSHLKQADKKDVDFVIICGEQELAQQSVMIKKMKMKVDTEQKQELLAMNALYIYFERMKLKN